MISLLSCISFSTVAQGGSLVLLGEPDDAQQKTIKARLSHLEQGDLVLLDKAVWKTTLVHDITAEQAKLLLPHCQQAISDLPAKKIICKIEETGTAQWGKTPDKIIHKLLSYSNEVETIINNIKSRQEVNTILEGPSGPAELEKTYMLPALMALPKHNHFGNGLANPGYNSFAVAESPDTLENKNKATDIFSELQKQALEPHSLIFGFTEVRFQYIENGEVQWSTLWDLRS